MNLSICLKNRYVEELSYLLPKSLEQIPQTQTWGPSLHKEVVNGDSF